MSDEWGVNHHSRDSGLVPGIIAGMTVLAIGYAVFITNARIDPEQVRCMIANPGFDCELGWVKAKPLPTGERDETPQ